MLEATNLQKDFGGILALDGVSFAVRRREIFAIIGPNGAGKTTLLNLISGVFPPAGGDLRFQSRPLNHTTAHARAALGLARTFQNLRLFNDMTVLENVMVGRHTSSHYGLVEAALRLPLARHEERLIREQASKCLGLVGLAGYGNRPVTSLSFGQQRLVEIARAIAAEPQLLLLDEPGAGLARREVEQLDSLICGLRQGGMTVILVEHNMDLVMGLADRVLVLDYGRKIAEDTPESIQRDAQVIAAYLGDDELWKGVTAQPVVRPSA